MKLLSLFFLAFTFRSFGESFYIEPKNAAQFDGPVLSVDETRGTDIEKSENVESKVDADGTGEAVSQVGRFLDDPVRKMIFAVVAERTRQAEEDNILKRLATVPLPYVCSAIEGATELTQSVLDKIPGIGIPIGEVVPGTKELSSAVSSGLQSMSKSASTSLSTLADMTAQFPGLGMALGYGTGFASSIIGTTADLLSGGITSLTNGTAIAGATGAIGSGIGMITDTVGTVGDMVNKGTKAGLDSVSGVLSEIPIFGGWFGSATGAMGSALDTLSGFAHSGLDKVSEISSLASGKVSGKPAKPLEIVQHICKTLQSN